MPIPKVPDYIKCLLEIDKVVELSTKSSMFIDQNATVEHLFSCAPVCSETSFLFHEQFLSNGTEAIWNHLHHNIAWVTV